MTIGDIFPVIVTALMLAMAGAFLWSERQRQERVDAENDRLRRENMRLFAGGLRLVNQIEAAGASPVWRPFSDPGPELPSGDQLVGVLASRFTREELEMLAHEIGLSIEDVGGATLSATALRLAEAARHRGIDGLLRGAVRRARPGAEDV